MPDMQPVLVALATLVLTLPITYLIRRIINWAYGFYDAKKEFLPNIAAFSLVCVSLVEDIGSIVLLHDDKHSVFLLFGAFTLFPILDAAFAELAECWEVPHRLDDLFVGLFFEAVQGLLFLYFADFSQAAVCFFGLCVLYQTVMVVWKTYSKEQSVITGGAAAFVTKYKMALGVMLAFSVLQFALALLGVELSLVVQIAFTLVPWVAGLALDLEMAVTSAGAPPSSTVAFEGLYQGKSIQERLEEYRRVKERRTALELI